MTTTVRDITYTGFDNIAVSATGHYIAPASSASLYERAGFGPFPIVARWNGNCYEVPRQASPVPTSAPCAWCERDAGVHTSGSHGVCARHAAEALAELLESRLS